MELAFKILTNESFCCAYLYHRFTYYYIIFIIYLFIVAAKLPSGIDIHHGVGTACEGWIHVPKPGGVKKGWTRAYAFVCDFKIFCHEPSNDVHSPSNAVFNIFDIRFVYVQ